MSAGAAMMVLGGGMQAMGQMQANRAEADAEFANAAFYREQADLSIRAAQKEKQLFDLESDQFLGTQINAFAKAGVDISDSVLMRIAGSKQRMSNESESIIETGKRNARMLLMKSQQSKKTANMMVSPEYNLLTAGGPLLSSAGMVLK